MLALPLFTEDAVSVETQGEDFGKSHKNQVSLSTIPANERSNVPILVRDYWDIVTLHCTYNDELLLGEKFYNFFFFSVVKKKVSLLKFLLTVRVIFKK